MKHAKWPALHTLAVALFVLQFVSGKTAEAGPLFGVVFDFGGDPQSSDQPFSRSSEEFSPIVHGNFFFMTAFGAADRGQVSAEVHGEIFAPISILDIGGTVLRQQEVIATMVLDDVTIAGPAGTTSVQTALNLHLDGATSANVVAAPGTSARASSSIGISGLANGVFFATRNNDVQSRGANSSGTSFFESGLLTGFSGDEDLVTPLLDLPVGSAFTLLLQLAVTAEVFADSNAVVEALASFAHTLSFPLQGPVFTLPDGYTVNSEQGGIQNNAWILAPQVGSVPEPATLALLGLGLAGLGIARRRRPA